MQTKERKTMKDFILNLQIHSLYQIQKYYNWFILLKIRNGLH